MTDGPRPTSDAPTSDLTDANGPVQAARWPPAVLAVVVVLVLVPALRMLALVRDRSRLQHADYWIMVDRFLTEGGGYRLAALFEFQNHPVVVPQLILWANIELFDGSNVALGHVVVAMVAIQLGIVAVALRRSPLYPMTQGAVLVVGSALLFGQAGNWNFARAMSGTAWLTANTFALGAILVRSRDRTIWAFALCALAAISYSTGAMSWIAVAAVGALHRPWRQWWRELPFAAGFLVTVLWYRANGISSGPSVKPSATQFLDVAAGLFGRAVGLTGHPARAASVVLVAGSAGLAVWLARHARVRGARAFAGIACFGILTTFQIAWGRFDLLSLFGEQSRYHSLSALAWLGFAGLVVLGARTLGAEAPEEGGPLRAGLVGFTSRPWVRALLLVPLAQLAFTAAPDDPAELDALKADQTMREIALRLDLADGTNVLLGPFSGPEPLSVTDRLRAAGHYPFVDGWDLDCGLLGQPLPDAEPAPADAGELVRGHVNIFLVTGVELAGRVDPAIGPRCLVITGDGDEVIGVGALGLPGVEIDGAVVEDGSAFRAFAPQGESTYRAHVVLDDGRVLTLSGSIEADEVVGALATARRTADEEG